MYCYFLKKILRLDKLWTKFYTRVNETKFKKYYSFKKRDKKIMNLGQKLKITEMLENGEKVAQIARKFSINESTIPSIRDDE